MLAAKQKAARASGPRKRKAAPPSGAAGRSKLKQSIAPSFDLSGLLAQAGWQEADGALARALRDFAALEKVSQSLGRKLCDGALSAHAQQVEGALLTVSQSLRQAGRKRNLQRFGEIGAVEAFDERLHVLTKPGKRAPARVKVVAQGVMRGLGPEAEIVLKALVAPSRSSAGAARKTV